MQLTINPLKETELILYGGEFYNGQKVSFQNLAAQSFVCVVFTFVVKSYDQFVFHVNADICIW